MAVKIGILYCTLLLGNLVVGRIIPEDDTSVFFDTNELEGHGRIVGGTVAAVGSHPWMVAIIAGTITFSMHCGGSIISQRTVLTAAHCIEGAPVSIFRLVVGSNQFATGGQRFRVAGFNIHPEYNPRTYNSDIATMFSTTNFVYSQLVRPIGLAFDSFDNRVQVRVAGWGRTTINDTGPASPQLLELTTTTISGQQCIDDMFRVAGPLNPPDVTPHNMLCTFHSPGRGFCTGDSGSPLVRIDRRQQVGIVSWGFLCARGAPDVYVRVSAFQTWISQNTI